MNCSIDVCKTKATVFGPLCPIMCDDHAKQAIRQGELEWYTIWPQHYERLGKKDEG